MEKDNKTLLGELGIDVHKISNSGHTLCPKCSHTRKKKNDPCLSVNVIEGTYNCWNDSCDFKGGVGGVKTERVVKEYTRPVFRNTTQLGNELVHWFSANRGISQRTLNEARVTESSSQDGKLWINFNYFRNEELINIKYRTIQKDFRLEKNAELIFYGLNDIKDSDWCVIVEGEIDRLSFMECGIKEVVSVPNGASKSSVANLEYLDNCIDYFKNKKKVILATDADEAGMGLRDELARRIGYDVCFKVDFKGYKDANELLVAKGVNELKSCLNEGKLIEFPMDGIVTTKQMWDKVKRFQKVGLQRGKLTKEMEGLDELISFEAGQSMVLTGIPNHGKSPFALMIMVCLSIHHGWKWAMFTPEHNPLEIFLLKMCELLIGRRVNSHGMSDVENDLAEAFLDKHFYFIQPEDENYTLDNILAKAKDLVVRKGINGILIDPWNKLEHNMGKGESETLYISKQLDKVIKFGKNHLVFNITIAHPTKIKKIFKSNLFEVPSLYDIAGSSNWYNKPDIGICFYRNFNTGNSEVYVQKMKYDHLGKQGLVQMKYNPANGRFHGTSSSYNNSNWLIPDAKPIAMDFPLEVTAEPTDGDLPF